MGWNLVAKRPMTIMLILAFLLLTLLAIAWYDGGREQQRLIEEDVQLPRAGQ